ncbi:MAG: T9SS type A sorting domain-containing protein [Candidatus Eisenbacteria bacterium]
MNLRHAVRCVSFALLFSALPGGVGEASADAAPITIDCDLSDWDPVPYAYQDASGDGGGSGIDFGKLWVANDGGRLYLRVETGGDVLIAESNSLTLYIDTDDNSSTGTAVAGMGADLTWVFGSRSGSYRGSSIYWDDIGVVASPPYTTNDLEFSLRRDAAPNGYALFPSTTVRIAFRDGAGGGDWVPGSSSNVSYTFDDSDPLDPPLIELGKSDPDHVRIMTHNVLNDGLWSRPNEFSRLLQAIDPDIIAYEEIYNHNGNQTKTWVQNVLPGTWYLDWDWELQILSRHPILQGWDTGEGQARAALIDLPLPFEHDLLVIAVHLKCCSDGDAQRQDQIDDVMSFVRDALSPGGAITLAQDTPIIILGDTNMYGDARQVTTLLTGDISDNGAYGPDFAPDWDGSELDAVVSRQPSVRQAYTYYNEGSSYGPSHIDRITVTGSVLNIDKSFVLHTPLLPPAVLAAAGLNADDSIVASDHAPHVMDFAAGTGDTAVENPVPVIPETRLSGSPNPFNPTTTLRFTLPEPGPVTLDVFDTGGRLVERLVDGPRDGGRNSVVWSPGSRAPSGVYLVRLRAGEIDQSAKVVLVR